MTQPAPLPPNEKQRLRALRSYNILDSEPELAFDDLVAVASHICDTPMALVSLVDESRQWFKAKVGLEPAETPREVAFCAHAILTPESVMQVPDPTADERFKNNPLVTGDPHIGFYAGAPLVTASGKSLGTLCVLDTEPRTLEASKLDALQALARQVVAQIEIRRTNLELRRRNDELSQFAYRVSHDFKSPLSASKRLADLILSDLADNDLNEVSVNAERLKAQMVKLEGFVEDMLNLARADLAENLVEEIDVESLLQEVVERHTLAASEREVKVLTEIEHGLTVRVARIRLFQVLDNLISNGIKYRNPKATDAFVTVACARNGDRVELVVSDNGVGIPDVEHDQVGKLFKRFHPELASGSGLGLAIVYKHIQSMGATIELRSDTSGTTFQVELPDGGG